jgi:hypothetical protein
MKRRHPRSNNVEHAMARALDQLAAYDEFQATLGPFFQKALKEGMSKEELEADPRLQALLVMREFQIALNSDDDAKALAAIRDLRDRKDGKATERVELKASLEALPEEQLDARLKTLLEATAARDSDADDELH